jgi:hypothetical protein
MLAIAPGQNSIGTGGQYWIGADSQALATAISFLTRFVAANWIHGDFVLTCDDILKDSELQQR